VIDGSKASFIMSKETPSASVSPAHSAFYPEQRIQFGSLSTAFRSAVSTKHSASPSCNLESSFP
jgi:hypothetical protein